MNLNTLNGGTVATKTWLNPVCSNLSCNKVTLDQNSAGGVPPAGFSLLYADNADRLKVAAPAAPIQTLAYLSDLVAPISSSEIVSVDLSSKVQCLNGSEIKASTDNIDRIIIDNAITGLYTKNAISGPSGAFLSLNNNGTFALNSRFVDNGGVDCAVNKITVVGPQAKSSIELTDATITTGLFNGFSRVNREIMDASSQTFLDGNLVERIKITNSGVVINNAYELPPTAGAANTIITCNGLGGTSWQAPVATNPFNQSLNTSDSPQFVNVNFNGNYTLPTSAGANNYVIASNGLGGTTWQPVSALTAGVTVTFGGSVNNINDFYRYDATYLAIVSNLPNVVGNCFVSPVAVSGVSLSWDTSTGNNTTTFNIYVNNVATSNFNLTGTRGVISSLPISLAVGDTCQIRYIAGTAPGNSQVTLYFT